MKIPPELEPEVYQALNSAFETFAEMRLLARFELDLKIQQMPGADYTLDLIDRMQAKNQAELLIRGALNRNPTNGDLRAVAEKLGIPPPRLTMPDDLKNPRRFDLEGTLKECVEHADRHEGLSGIVLLSLCEPLVAAVRERLPAALSVGKTPQSFSHGLVHGLDLAKAAIDRLLGHRRTLKIQQVLCHMTVTDPVAVRDIWAAAQLAYGGDCPRRFVLLFATLEDPKIPEMKTIAAPRFTRAQIREWWTKVFAARGWSDKHLDAVVSKRQWVPPPDQPFDLEDVYDELAYAVNVMDAYPQEDQFVKNW